ncbi:MAG: hypothetical protein GY757_10830, partial [bacterium]|nr:hypothetical protein [bacterium]
TVWKYVNPVVRGGVLAKGEQPGNDHRGHYLNAVFKVRRYATNYPGLRHKKLTAGNVIELPASQKGKTGLDGKSERPNERFGKRKKKRDKRSDILNSLGYLK